MMHLSTHIDQQTVCKACSNDSINKKRECTIYKDRWTIIW